jgi:hypothetical protein
MNKPRNDISSAVPKFCLTLEEFRRTPEGRVRTAQEFLSHFFPYDEKGAKDGVFHYVPKEVRGPMLITWGLRAQKSALRDSDEKVRDVVHDALLAGDLDAEAFEQGISAQALVSWLPLHDWWRFWRSGKVTKEAITKALDVAFALGFFDPKVFLDSLEGRSGRVKGTDVIGEGLSKAELLDWVRKVYTSGDCSAKGMLAALGWDVALQKTPNDALLGFLDSVATRIGLSVSETDGHFVTARPDEESLPRPPPLPATANGPPGGVPQAGVKKPALQVVAAEDEEETMALDRLEAPQRVS